MTTDPFADYTPVRWLPRWFFPGTRRDMWLDEQMTKKRAAEVRAEREETAAWCPEFRKALRGRVPGRCEHTDRHHLLPMLRRIARDSYRPYRRQALQKLIDRYQLPGANPPRKRYSGGGGDYYPSERQRQHEWYGDHSDLDWHDRTTAEMYGMDVETYLSNYLND